MRNHKPTEFISAMLHSNLRVIVEHKICKQCKSDKLLEDFSKYPRNRDGRDTVCKVCRYENFKSRNKDKKKEKDFWSDYMPI